MYSPEHLPRLEKSVWGPPVAEATLTQSAVSSCPWIMPQMFSRSKSHESRKVEPPAEEHFRSTINCSPLDRRKTVAHQGNVLLIFLVGGFFFARGDKLSY